MDRRRFLETLSIPALAFLPAPQNLVHACADSASSLELAQGANRKVVLGIGTTGLDSTAGHRIVEIAAIEIVGQNVTGCTYHSYINPERDSDSDALLVHGLTRAILGDKPKFADIAHELVEFIESDTLIVHDAPLYLEFLQQEFSMAGHEIAPALFQTFIDTLELARQIGVAHPSIVKLCAQFGVALPDDTGQFAFQDALAVARIYLAMTR